MLARLGRWLRMLGHDTLIASNKLKDESILDMAEGRILLTRDGELFRKARKRGINCILLSSKNWKEQLVELMEHGIELETGESRCTICNGELEQIARGYYVCKSCGKVYWEGSHLEKVERVVKTLKKNAHKSKQKE